MCAVQAFSLEPSYSRGTDCTKVTCYLARWSNNAMVMFQEVCLENKNFQKISIRILLSQKKIISTFSDTIKIEEEENKLFHIVLLVYTE